MAEDDTFKVRDRRRRDEADESPVVPAPSEPTAQASSTPATGSVFPAADQARPGSPDLQGLFVMLASTALANLGEAADPETGERVLDLEQARDAINLLLLLRLKTEGNRTDQESHLLEEMLYDLQLHFVRAAKGASSS